VDRIELQRFMGDWWVIANIPNALEKGCHNSLETYRMRPDGDIDNDFQCHVGSFDGKLKKMTGKAWVHNTTTNAEWRIRFFWPITFDYVVTDLTPDYENVVVAHPSRDYVWIMSRKKTMDGRVYDQFLQSLKTQGYDTTKIIKIPQRSADPVSKSAGSGHERFAGILEKM
jgi:apolipoprotein D and lipocalin family protein